MPDGKMDLNQFIIALCESPHRWIKQATEGLTDEQLFYQPTPDTNSIAWLVWHLSRWRDKVSASIVGEPQVWTSQGWDQRFNIPGERTGLGDTLEQVAAFRVDRDSLLAYANAAHDALVQRVSRLTPEQFEKPVEYLPGSSRPAWRALVSVMGDSSEHTGQINYLRVCSLDTGGDSNRSAVSLTGGPGWPTPLSCRGVGGVPRPPAQVPFQ